MFWEILLHLELV